MLVETPKGPLLVREASMHDLPALVFIHVTSFNATYPNHHPKPSYELREQQWQLLLTEKPDNWFCLVAQVVNGPVVGFATGHDFTDPHLPHKGQLDKIHFLKPYQRLGLGGWLVLLVVERFLQNGIQSMILFSDPANPATQFYDALQGERLTGADQSFSGTYGWKNLHALATLLRKRQKQYTFYR